MSVLDPFLGGDEKRAQFAVRPRPLVPLPQVDGLLAGAAEADITPPPGLPKAGYSSNAHDGRGFRTRLRARVLHLRAGNASLAIVQCDLLGGSAVLQHLVAAEIADRADVPLAGLMIGATHTHAGPGQFLGTDFYNRFASNRPGFDPRWTKFLVTQIADAVVAACESRVPARLAVGSAEVYGFTRNRSLDPHVHNDSVADKRLEAQRKFVSVNPLLHMVRVDERDGGPLAAAIVFSVHGTGISQHSHEYNADVWGYLVGECAHRIEQRHGRRAIVGAIEGTHGDVAPAIRPGLAGHMESERIGRGIGAEAAALHERLGAELRDDVVLGCGLREIDLDRSDGRRIDGVELPRRAAVGAALVAGAKENFTPVIHRLPPFRAGMPKRWWWPRNPQQQKWVLGSRFLQPLLLRRRGFPLVLPVQVLRVDDTMLVGMPFEVTVESGRRFAAAVERSLGSAGEAGIGRVIVSSVANEYSGYVTTPEEYTRQYYEGGHTIYGPNTEPFLSAHAAKLTGEVVRDGAVSDVLRVRAFDVGIGRYWPHREPDALAPARRFLGPARFTDPTQTEDGYWEITWLDAAPGNLRWHEPLVRVEVHAGAAGGPSDGGWAPARREGRVVDDQGWDLEVFHLGPAPDGAPGHYYRVRWFDPAFRAGTTHRFVLCANAGRDELASPPFD